MIIFRRKLYQSIPLHSSEVRVARYSGDGNATEIVSPTMDGRNDGGRKKLRHELDEQGSGEVALMHPCLTDRRA